MKKIGKILKCKNAREETRAGWVSVRKTEVKYGESTWKLL